jgi:hypothetical protein
MPVSVQATLAGTSTLTDSAEAPKGSIRSPARINNPKPNKNFEYLSIMVFSSSITLVRQTMLPNKRWA